MSDYIIWVQRTQNSWERRDAPTLEFARAVFEEHRTSGEQAVVLTRLVSTAGPAASAPAPAREAGATPVFGAAAASRAADRSAPTPRAPAVSGGAPATAEVGSAISKRTGDSSSSSSEAGSIADLEIRLLNQLKDAFRELDQPTVWRIVRWALEYAKHANDGK